MLIRNQLRWVKPYYLLTKPLIDLGQPRLQRLKLVFRPDLGSLSQRPETTRILRHDTHQLWRDAQGRKQVVAADVLD